ncbi:hypothetical protein [Streptomyces sp. HUAS ZL42]|uniref:hypothetical protein n=1 Tax=Streptomyces sp. HUAS ZL42 TaxID=3231715 RepID=UPI00345E0C13
MSPDVTKRAERAQRAQRAEQIVAELAANAALHDHVQGRGFRLALTPDTTTGLLRIAVTDAKGGRRVSSFRAEEAVKSGRRFAPRSAVRRRRVGGHHLDLAVPERPIGGMTATPKIWHPTAYGRRRGRVEAHTHDPV